MQFMKVKFVILCDYDDGKDKSDYCEKYFEEYGPRTLLTGTPGDTRKKAIEHGWLQDDDGNDYCPACAKRMGL